MAAAVALHAGTLVRFHYRDKMWRERLLLKTTIPQTMREVIGGEPSSEPVWWLLSPDGDAYPDEIA